MFDFFISFYDLTIKFFISFELCILDWLFTQNLSPDIQFYIFSFKIGFFRFYSDYFIFNFISLKLDLGE
jgi:hypothetical protein